MASAAARGYINPSHFYLDRAGKELESIREEKKYRDNICVICTRLEYREIRHHHISSEFIRHEAIDNRQKEFWCLLCKELEPVERPETRHIILTSSTLYGVWKAVGFKPDLHMEIETIPGARYRDLLVVLKALYLAYPQRMDIVVACGLNNIGEGQAVPDIIDEVWELKNMVEAHSLSYKHQKKNTISFCTLLLPPKFCSLYVPHVNKPAWEPGPDFINRTQEILCLNAAIKAINRAAGLKFVNLHGFGTRLEKGLLMHKHETNPEKQVWREREVRRKLHLTMENKHTVMARINKYFVSNCL